MLKDLCAAIAELLGYGAAVVNIYRPAYDDMLTAAAVAPRPRSRRWSGRSSPADTWYPLLAERFERRGAYFVPGDEFDWESLGADTYVPDIEPSDDPDAWTAEDALFVPLRDSKGELIGVISVDEPETGRRPSDDELDALVAITQQAAIALRIAQETANTVQHQRMLEGVLAVSARLAEADETDEVLQAVCDGIHDALEFDRVVIELADDPAGRSTRWPRAAGAWSRRALTRGRLDRLARAALHRRVRGRRLLPDPDRGGRGAARPPSAAAARSELNGRGPHAWTRHWLLVPLDEPEGRRLGLISVDDPRDRLLPTRARLQALRLFANQAVAPLQTADRAVRLRHEATHDPLTGLPNRRAFLARLSREAGRSKAELALILCDMDNLKRVNDRHGHDAGDRALKVPRRRPAHRSTPQRRRLPDRWRRVRRRARRRLAARCRARGPAPPEGAGGRARRGRGHPGELRDRRARPRRDDRQARRARRPAALRASAAAARSPRPSGGVPSRRCCAFPSSTPAMPSRRTGGFILRSG